MEFLAGRSNATQAAYWKAKPPQEFYNVAEDPFEVRNLITEPQYADHISKLKSALRAEMIATRDTGFIPEGMLAKLAGKRTIYDYAQSEAYPLERIIALADTASDRNAANLPTLLAALDDPHPVVRYWGATGCLILQDRSAAAKEKLRQRLSDDWLDIRVVAAEAIAYLGEQEAAIATIADVLKSGNTYEVLAAQNALDFLYQAGHVPLSRAQQLVRGAKGGEPTDRIPRYLLDLR